MKYITAEDELEAERELFIKELDEVTNNFGFRLLLILGLSLVITYTAICTHPDLYFYSLLQYFVFSLALLTWDFIDTNKEADKIFNKSYERTYAIINKHYPIGE